MLQIGTSVSADFFIRLNHLADLVEYYGPVLRLLRDERGSLYLQYWCDSDDVHNRWLLQRTSPHRLRSYLNGTMSLLNLLRHTNSAEIYVLDTDSSQQPVNLRKTDFSSFPEAYFPDEMSYYQQDASTSQILTSLAPDLNSKFSVVQRRTFSLPISRKNRGSLRGLFVSNRVSKVSHLKGQTVGIPISPKGEGIAKTYDQAA